MVDEENGRAVIMGKVRIRKNGVFQAMSFGRALVVLFCLHLWSWEVLTVVEVGGGGGISEKKGKRHSKRLKVNLYEVCAYFILFTVFFILL